ncbi:MAG: chorismate-binding protein [Candidatus Baltobacteraceae bacterium]
MSLRVACAGIDELDFRDPLVTLRARSLAEAVHALAEAERALADGYWIAGYLNYALGSAFHALPVDAAWPLLAIGIFKEPLPRAGGTTEIEQFAPPLPLFTEPDYARAIEAIVAAIRDGEVYQVNYSVPFHVALAGDPYELWSAIAARTDARYQAFVRDEERTALSWSPELFLRFEGDTLVVRPMKGTAALDRCEELLNEKNRAENLMIVDVLRNDLHRLGARVETERLLEIERYPTFATMTSTLRADLGRSPTLAEIFAATFPCASVTGAPKRAAMEYIARLEGGPREIYCGSIGYLAPERRGWWNVAIRTVQRDATSTCVRVGGGILCDSRTADERSEIDTKLRFLREAAPFELWETLASDASDSTIELHLQRLASAAQRLRITFDLDALRTSIDDARGSAAMPTLLRVRLGNRGTFSLHRATLERPDAIDIALSPMRVRSDDPWLRIKSSYRPAHERAAAQAERAGCFDALLANERGELTEGSRTNLFIRRGGRLLTPALDAGLLPGILRSTLLADGSAEEATILPRDLARAEAIYLGNSARGLLRVRSIRPATDAEISRGSSQTYR